MAKKEPDPHPNARALASEWMWWDCGQELLEASEQISAWIERREFSSTISVGEPVAGRGDTSRNWVWNWRRRLIAEMLYAFAVEDWLKGLLVGSYERASEKRRRKIDAEISKLTYPAARDDREYILQILEAMKVEPVRSEIERHDRERTDEVIARREAALEHMSHNLTALAQAAGVKLGKDERRYLAALSIVNQIGRYPALAKSSSSWNLDPIVGSENLKKKLNAAIRARYEKVLDMTMDRKAPSEEPHKTDVASTI